MPVDFKKLFGLEENFTKDQLKNSLIKKIFYIENLNINQIEKKILIDGIYSEYNKAKEYLLYDRQFGLYQPEKFNPLEQFNYIARQHQDFYRQFDNIFTAKDLTIPKISLDQLPDSNSKNFSKSVGQSYSMQSILNPDGSRTVIESTDNMVNGKSNLKVNSYNIDLLGNKTSIPLDKVKKYIENK